MKNYLLSVSIFFHFLANAQIAKVESPLVDMGYFLTSSSQNYLIFRGGGDILLQDINSEQTHSYLYKINPSARSPFVRSSDPQLLGGCIVHDYTNNKFLALIIDANALEHTFEVNDYSTPLFQLHGTFYTYHKSSNGYEIGKFNLTSMEWEVFYSNEKSLLSFNGFDNKLFITEKNGDEKIFFSLDEQSERLNLKTVIESDDEPFSRVGDYDEGFLIKKDTLISNVPHSIVYTYNPVTLVIEQILTIKQTSFVRIRGNELIRRDYGDLSKYDLSDLDTKVNFTVNGSDEVAYSVRANGSGLYTLLHYSCGMELAYLDDNLDFMMYDALTPGMSPSHPSVGYTDSNTGLLHLNETAIGELVTVIQVPATGRIYLAKILDTTYELIAELPQDFRWLSINNFTKCENRYFTHIGSGSEEYDRGLYEVFPSNPIIDPVAPCENNVVHEIGLYLRYALNYPHSHGARVFSLLKDQDDNLILSGTFNGFGGFIGDDILLTSNAQQELEMSGDLFIAKYDTCGNDLWITTIGRTSTFGYRSEIALNSTGDVFFTTTINDSLKINGNVYALVAGTYLIALNGQTGELRWFKRLPGSPFWQNDLTIGHKVLVTPDDLLCVATSSEAESLQLDDIVLTPASNTEYNALLAFNSDGVAQWGKLFEFASESRYVQPFLLLYDDFYDDIIMLSQKRSYRHIVPGSFNNEYILINRLEVDGSQKAETAIALDTTQDSDFTYQATGYAADAFVNNEGRLVIVGNYTGRFKAGIIELESPKTQGGNNFLQTYFALQMNVKGEVLPEVVNGIKTNLFPIKLITNDAGERVLLCGAHRDKLLFVTLDEKGMLLEKMETEQTLDFSKVEYEAGFTAFGNDLLLAKTGCLTSISEGILPQIQLSETITTMRFAFEGDEILSDFTEFLVHPAISEKEPFKLFPNPTTGNIYLAYYPDAEVKDLILYNSLGQIAFTMASPLPYEYINIQTLQTGYYTVHVTVNGELKTYKIIKI
jgi:outer membrane protein assembly factor BamB